MDEFSVIGIAPEATPEQITTAWKAAARLTHPDMFPEATAEQRKYLNDRMAALNAAYHTLSDPAGLARARRLRQAASHNEADLRPENAATPEGRAGSRHPQPPARPAATDGCELCGSVPSARMSSSRSPACCSLIESVRSKRDYVAIAHKASAEKCNRARS